MHVIQRVAAFAAAFLFSAFLFGQNTASITGKVITTGGAAVTDASVTLLELRRTVKAGSDGTFRFDALPAGHYHLHAESTTLGSAVGDGELAAGQTLAVEITMDPAVHYEEIVVSAGPDARRASEVYQPVNVVGQDEVAAQMQPTLGETLNQESGVASTYFGPGSSRPVIRGVGGDRIRILEEGVGTGDASNVSPDHAVSVDPAKAQQIEIVRGPATLLYGSNAVGGLVNVIDNRVPTRVPTEAVTGTVDLRAGTGANERNGSVTLDGGSGRFAWHLDLVDRSSDDVDIPGPADELDDPAEFNGKLENSSLEARSGTAGASWVGERGFLGLAVTGFSTNYGIPGHAHHHKGEEEEEEAPVRIDMDQRRLDLRGELTQLTGPFQNARLRVGLNAYEHTELEGDEAGTRFTNDRLEARVDARHRPLGIVTGVAGAQVSDNDFSAIGEEAFVPPNTIKTFALFVFEEATRGRFDFQFGGRYENQDIEADAADLPSRTFGGISVSGGAIYRPREPYAIAVSLARTVRMPTASELYANGPHIATRQFEIGDPTLHEETSLGLDVSLRKTEGRVRGQVNFFSNSFDGYIYDAATGDEADELPVFQYVQTDARFSGIEVETHTELWHRDEHHLELEAGADYVRGSLRGDEADGDLPRIPPLRASLGLRYQHGQFAASAEAWRYATQRRVAEFEESTPGYTLVNTLISYRFLTTRLVHDVLLRGTNLTDKLARSHVSPLKETVPLPGRDITLAYRVTF